MFPEAKQDAAKKRLEEESEEDESEPRTPMSLSRPTARVKMTRHKHQK